MTSAVLVPLVPVLPEHYRFECDLLTGTVRLRRRSRLAAGGRWSQVALWRTVGVGVGASLDEDAGGRRAAVIAEMVRLWRAEQARLEREAYVARVRRVRKARGGGL